MNHRTTHDGVTIIDADLLLAQGVVRKDIAVLNELAKEFLTRKRGDVK